MTKNQQNLPKPSIHIEFLGIIPSEIQSEGLSRMIHRWRITLPDLPPFLIEALPENHAKKLQEQILFLQEQYPEVFAQANQDKERLFSDKFLQEWQERIEKIRQEVLYEWQFE